MDVDAEINKKGGNEQAAFPLYQYAQSDSNG